MIEDFFFLLMIGLKSLHCRPCIKNLRPTLIIWATATLDVRALPTNAWKSTSTWDWRPAQMAYGSKRYTRYPHQHMIIILLCVENSDKKKKKDFAALQGKKTESYICFSLCVSAAKQQTKPSTIRRFEFLSQHLPIIFRLSF